MNSLSPEVVQLLAGVAGAFVGGLLLVWRIRTKLPHVLNQLVTVVVNAVRSMVAEELRAVLEGELKQPLRRIAALEYEVARLGRVERDTVERLTDRILQSARERIDAGALVHAKRTDT
jgi:hypothetical protein